MLNRGAMMFIGREDLLEKLKGLWQKNVPSLVTCRGRRRIGKSTLIREFAANKTLNAVDSILWVSDALTLCNLTDEAVALLGNSNNGRRSAVTFAVSNNLWLTSDHVSEGAVV